MNTHKYRNDIPKTKIGINKLRIFNNNVQIKTKLNLHIVPWIELKDLPLKMIFR